MKLMIASDLHGSAYYTEKLLDAFQREGADRLLLLGDLLYFGPRNSIPEGHDPKGVITLLSGVRERLLCVRGNCDAEVDQMVLPFPILAEYALLYWEGRTLYAVHGHHEPPPLCPGDILLYGHTHVPAWMSEGGNLRLNPGSVTHPKEGSLRGYMTLDEEEFLWKDLEGTVYHRLSL